MATFKFLSISYEGSDETVVQLLGRLANQLAGDDDGAPEMLPAPVAQPAALPPPSNPSKAPRAAKARAAAEAPVETAPEPAGEEVDRRKVWTPERRAKHEARKRAKQAASNGDPGEARSRHSGTSAPINPMRMGSK